MDKHGISGLEDRDLVRRSDDFSEQLSDPADDRFWVRIEKPLGDHLRVTDLLFGKQDELGMAHALGQALLTLGVNRPSSIVFTNLGHADDFATGQAVVRVRKVVEAMVLRQRRFISETRTIIDDGKVDLIVAFRSFD
jgi:hypothetical protein